MDLISAAVSAGWSLDRIAIARRSSLSPATATRTSCCVGLLTGTISGDGLVVPGDDNLLALRYTVEKLAEAGLRFQCSDAHAHGGVT